MPITLALFDMAATTVDDMIDGCPLVLQSFADSFHAVHVTVPGDILNAQRGKDKIKPDWYIGRLTVRERIVRNVDK